MAMRRNHKGEDSFYEEKAVDPADHSQDLPQILLSFGIVPVATTVSVVMEAKNLQRRVRHLLHGHHMTPGCHSSRGWRCGSVYLWYEVQECVTREGPHRQTHKQLQDEGVGLLAGVEENQADTQHGAQCDEHDSRRAVTELCREERDVSRPPFPLPK